MDILKLGFIFGGIALLSKKQPSSIGKVHDSRVKGSVPCNNGRYSDSFPKTGACSRNGGVDVQKIYNKYLSNNGMSTKSIKVGKDSIKIDFGKKTYHEMSRIDRVFKDPKLIKDVKMKRAYRGELYIKSLEMTANFNNRKALIDDTLKKLSWLDRNNIPI